MADSMASGIDGLMPADKETPEDLLGNGGILKKILTPGKGWETPETGDSVSVHYVGTLASDGTKFDSSRDRDEPFVFELGMGKVIKGWDEGVRSMKKGEKAILTCRSDYAYGKAGSPPKIPADATLDFEVELLSWKSTKDITDDGGVSKAILEEGKDWKKPGALDEVLVKYELRATGSGKVMAASSGEGEEISLSAGSHTCKALPIAVKTMKQGERAQLTIQPAYGVGEDVLEGELTLVSWKAVQDVKSDGGIIKKTLVETSDWNKPNPEAKVVVRFTASLPDGTVFEERGEGNELHFAADEDEVIEGLDLAVQEMKLAEEALVTLQPRYAYGEQGYKGPLAAVPPLTVVTFRVHLVSFEKAQETYELETPDKIAKAQGYKDAGVEAFKAARNARACKLWNRAMKLLEHDTQYEQADKLRARDIKRSCNLNLAAAELRLQQYPQAVAACNKVLDTDAGNVKALYRRAQAQLALGYFIEAQQDVKAVLLQDDGNRDAKALQLRVRKQLAASNKRQAALYSNMFKPRPAAEKHKANGVATNGIAANGPSQPESVPADVAAAAVAAQGNEDMNS